MAQRVLDEIGRTVRVGRRQPNLQFLQFVDLVLSRRVQVWRSVNLSNSQDCLGHRLPVGTGPWTALDNDRVAPRPLALIRNPLQPTTTIHRHTVGTAGPDTELPIRILQLTG